MLTSQQVQPDTAWRLAEGQFEAARVPLNIREEYFRQFISTLIQSGINPMFLDTTYIPESLRPLLPMAEKWGIGDDFEREEALKLTSLTMAIDSAKVKLEKLRTE